MQVNAKPLLLACMATVTARNSSMTGASSKGPMHRVTARVMLPGEFWGREEAAGLDKGGGWK